MCACHDDRYLHNVPWISLSTSKSVYLCTPRAPHPNREGWNGCFFCLYSVTKCLVCLHLRAVDEMSCASALHHLVDWKSNHSAPSGQFRVTERVLIIRFLLHFAPWALWRLSAILRRQSWFIVGQECVCDCVSTSECPLSANNLIISFPVLSQPNRRSGKAFKKAAISY